MSNVDLLRQALMGIQAHAAGLHASADMALKILAGMRAEEPAPQLPKKPNGLPTHYGDPEPEMEAVFARLEQSGGATPNTPGDGDRTLT